MERKSIRSLCPIMPASRSRGLVYNVICCARLSGGLTGSVSGFLIVSGGLLLFVLDRGRRRRRPASCASACWRCQFSSLMSVVIRSSYVIVVYLGCRFSPTRPLSCCRPATMQSTAAAASGRTFAPSGHLPHHRGYRLGLEVRVRVRDEVRPRGRYLRRYSFRDGADVRGRQMFLYTYIPAAATGEHGAEVQVVLC